MVRPLNGHDTPRLPPTHFLDNRIFTDAAIFRDERVSMEAILQRQRDANEPVPVVITTHETEEAAMRRALSRIAALATIAEPPRMIRIEPLER